MSAPNTTIEGWYRSTPSRRPRSDREVELPTKQPVVSKTLFAGLFRRKLTERFLNQMHDEILKLDTYLAKENYTAVTAAYYQLAVEAAVRIKRPDLIKEFEAQRDQAILDARSAPRLRQRKAK